MFFPSVRRVAPSLGRRFYSPGYRYVRFSTPNSPKTNQYTPLIKLAIGAGAFGSVYYVTHLEQVPETGRWRFMNISPTYEAKLEGKIQAGVLQEFQGQVLPRDHPLTRHVRRVASRIITSSNLGTVRGEATVSQLSNFQDVWNMDGVTKSTENASKNLSEKEWEVIVIHNQRLVNAFAVPGLVAVSTGMLPICQDEQGLAAVLGHEIGHVVLRHSMEKLSSNTLITGVYIILALLGIDFGTANLFGTVLYELPNSRGLEREADIVGLRLMAKACYDPKAAPGVFRRMEQLERKAAPKFLNTHPLSTERVKYLEEQLPEAYDILASNPECARLNDQLQRFEDARRLQTVSVPVEVMEDAW